MKIFAYFVAIFSVVNFDNITKNIRWFIYFLNTIDNTEVVLLPNGRSTKTTAGAANKDYISNLV